MGVVVKILGISAYYHDSAAALLVDGCILAAAQEERFTRKKHDAGFPHESVAFCLKEAGCDLDDIDLVVFYEKPFLRFERLIETYLHFAPRGFKSFSKAMPIWLGEKIFQKKIILDELAKFSRSKKKPKLIFSEHHFSHAASAFYPSPFEEALILTMDGVGEWTTTSAAIGRGSDIQIFKEIHFPHSLGLLYTAFTYHAGFKVNSGEYKLMGLAPYGAPKYASLIRDHLIDVKEDGSFRLDLSYFDYATGLKMTNDKFSDLFGLPSRNPESDLTQDHMDLAASIQCVLEEVVVKLVRSLVKETGLKNLCLAGGVALNCVANGKIVREKIVENLWIQPASGDAGGALGAAFAGYYFYKNQKRIVSEKRDAMQGSYLGPKFSQTEVESRLTVVGAHFHRLSDADLFQTCANTLDEGKALGWFQGRMEFGPRSLGARSILGDARSPTMQSVLNLKVKYRESFRPFAPAILRERVSEWFDLDQDSPYMLLVAPVTQKKQKSMTQEETSLFGIEKLKIPRSEIPAVTHVDYSARIQTVHSDTNPRFHRLLTEFERHSGCPVLVNTSFNIRGEPIVCTPEDAFRCFMGSEIEVLAIENCLLFKNEQNPDLKLDYLGNFERD